VLAISLNEPDNRDHPVCRSGIDKSCHRAGSAPGSRRSRSSTLISGDTTYQERNSMHTLKNGLAAILVRVDDGMDLARAVRRSVTAMNTGIGMTHSPIPPDRQGSRWGQTNRSPSPPLQRREARSGHPPGPSWREQMTLQKSTSQKSLAIDDPSGSAHLHAGERRFDASRAQKSERLPMPRVSSWGRDREGVAPSRQKSFGITSKRSWMSWSAPTCRSLTGCPHDR
jgi:hypothetical protein